MERMNNLKSIFEEIFHSDVIVDSAIPFVQGNKTKYSINLVEEGVFEANLIGFDDIYFVIDFDKHKFIHSNSDSTYRNCLLIAKKIRKACDYIIWAKFNGHDILLLIELKSKHNKDIPDKFKSSNSFIAYFNSLLKEHYNYDRVNGFEVIPLLINDKTNRLLLKEEQNGYYIKGIKQTGNKEFHIKHEFEKIIGLD